MKNDVVTGPKFATVRNVSVGPTENHLAFVLVAVNRVINRTVAKNETLLIPILHCNIYFALNYPEKSIFTFVNSVILTKMLALFASLFVQLAVT